MVDHSDTEERVADAVVVSYAPSDDRTTDSLDARSYRAYLHRVHHGPVSVGDEWEEFVNCGCGTTRDVTLRVDSVRDGNSIGEETEFIFEASHG